MDLGRERVKLIECNITVIILQEGAGGCIILFLIILCTVYTVQVRATINTSAYLSHITA